MRHGQDHRLLPHGLLDRTRAVDVARGPDQITVLIPLVDLGEGTAKSYLRLARERNLRAAIEQRPDGLILLCGITALLCQVAGSGCGSRQGGRGDCCCHLVLADEQERDGDREQRNRAGHPEGGVKSASQRGVDGVPATQQRGVVAGGDARGDRDPERTAELLGGIDQPGCEPGFLVRRRRRAPRSDTGMNVKAVPIPTATRNGPNRSPR